MTRPFLALAAVALAVGVLATAPASAAPAPATPAYTGRLLVTVKAHRTARAHAAVTRAGARQVAGVPRLGVLTIVPDLGQTLNALIHRLVGLPGVRGVVRERQYAPRGMPNDPALSTDDSTPGVPTGTPLQWWPQREDFFKAWDLTRGDGSLVAVIDTGADPHQPDLVGKIASSVNLDRHAGTALGDAEGHGTWVSGAACGATNNGFGIAGAGYDCRLLVERSDLSETSVMQAIMYATDHGADAINMSFGGPGGSSGDPIGRAIDDAYAHGVAMVAAAADTPGSGDQGEPADLLQPEGTGSQIRQGKGLSVTAADFNDRRAGFAGSGSEISMAAYGAFRPGDQTGGRSGPPGIFGDFPGNPTTMEQGSLLQTPCGCRTSLDGDDRFAYLEGTSMAAPQVAGVLAMAHHLNPGVPLAKLLEVMKSSARQPTGRGWNPDLGWGILDAGAAIDAVRALDVTPPESRARAPRRTRRRGVSVRFAGRDPRPAPVVHRSGIAKYGLYVARGHGRYRLRGKVRNRRGHHRRIRLRLRRGTYRYYSIAVDRAGNRQAVPAKPDGTIRVRSRRRTGS